MVKTGQKALERWSMAYGVFVYSERRKRFIPEMGNTKGDKEE